MKILHTKDKALKLVNELIAENKALKTALAQPAKELDHGDELTIAYMSGVHRGKELAAQTAQEPVQWSAYEYDEIHHKPVAWMDRDGNFSDNNDYKCFPIPLCTITHPTPQQRPWVNLTDDEKYILAEDVTRRDVPVFEVICKTEAKLKDKNT